MEFFKEHYLDLLGIMLSGGGLGVALWAALGAQSAKSAAIDARDRVVGRLTSVDIQRAIDLIERLKDRHNASRWEAALERYPELRALLFDIEARLPELDSQKRNELTNAATQVRELEDLVNESVSASSDIDGVAELTSMLNRIQSILQELASELKWDSGGGSNQ